MAIGIPGDRGAPTGNQRSLTKGARYKAPDYEGTFTPYGQTPGFVEVRAADNSEQILEAGRREQRQFEALEKGYERKAAVDRAELDADAAQIRANYEQVKADFARAKAGTDIVASLAKLSGTLAKDIATINEIQQEKADNEAQVLSAFNVSGQQEVAEQEGNTNPETNTPVGQSATTQTTLDQTKVVAETDAVDEVATTPEEDGTLREPIQVKTRLRATERGNAYQVAADLPGYVNGRLADPNFVYRTPDGRTFTATTIETQADLNFVLNSILRDFYAEAGIAKLPTKQVVSVVLPQVRALRNSLGQTLGRQLREGQVNTTYEKGRTTANAGLAAGENVESIWRQLYTDIYASGKYPGDKAAATRDAVAIVLEWAKANGRTDVIDKLAKVLKRPGVKGTELGSQYATLFAKARTGSRDEVIREGRRQTGEAQLQVKGLSDQRLIELAKANSDEEERSINRRTIESLRELGTPEALSEADKLERGGLSYNPFTATELTRRQEAGEVFTQAELTEMVRNRDITVKEAEGLGWSKTGGLSKDSAALNKANNFKSEVTGIAKGVLIGSMKSGSDHNKDRWLKSQGVSIQADISERLNKKLRIWIRQNPEATNADIRAQLGVWAEQMQGEVTYTSRHGFKYNMGGPDGGQAPIKDLKPTILDTRTGVRRLNYTNYDLPEIKTVAKDIKITRDVVLTDRQVVQAHEARLKGLPYSKRVTELAKMLGTNEDTLINAQAALNGFESIAGYQRDMPASAPIGNIDPQRLIYAITQKESGGNYKAINPHSGALGWAQVMPENIAPWSKEILGYAITPRMFLRSPELQRKIVVGKVNKYLAQESAKGYTGVILMRRVAALWYSGRAHLYNNTRTQYTKGHAYPSINDYTLDVVRKYRKG